MNKQKEIPFYAKFALIFIGGFALVYTMIIAQNIIIPIVYATIIAILLNPLVNYLVKKKFSRISAIAIAVSIAVTFVLAVLFVIFSQFTLFSDALPHLQLKFELISTDLIQWISKQFNIKEVEIMNWIKVTQNGLIQNLAVGDSISSISQLFATLMLLPVYLITILYYKPLFIEFLFKLFREENHTTVTEVLINSKAIIQTYLVGLLVEILIIAVLNSVGLLALGIDYAILLGILGALLNVIPYLGGVIAMSIFMVIALVTKTPIYMLYVAGLYSSIQFIDNNYIVPKIVASRVQINAFVSIIVVIIGGSIWGLSGMFLSIPVTAILKVIFDHVDSLKPWGFLLGNNVPTRKLKKK